jgi:hypothetical protein
MRNEIPTRKNKVEKQEPVAYEIVLFENLSVPKCWLRFNYTTELETRMPDGGREGNK